jgi:mRNA interferase ChpB
MDRGDIYLISRPAETEGEAPIQFPVVIVTQARFNRVTRTPIVLPIAPAESVARTAGFAVNLEGKGLTTAGVVRCDQPRTLDFTVGDPQRVEKLPLSVMDDVMAKLAAIINI